MPPPPTRSFELGEPLLPERAHDPHYYPGLVEDPEPDSSRARWGGFALVGAALIMAGLAARQYALRPESFRVIVETTPADARVQIDGVRVIDNGSPHIRTGLSAGDHEWLVEREGFATQREKFTLSKNDSDRRVVVNLVPEGKSELNPPATTAGEGTPDAAGQADAPLSKRELAKRRRSELLGAQRASRTPSAGSFAAMGFEPPRARRNPSEDAPPSSAGAQGMLKLNSVPWSEVYIDGQHVGHTPLIGLPLRAGRHKIELSNPQLDVRKSFTIKLRAGETLTRGEKLY